MKMYLIEAFEFEGLLSLDKNWIYNVSGTKENSHKIKALLTKESYNKLKEVSAKEFDYDYFDNLRENLVDLKADNYLYNNAKDMVLCDNDHIFHDDIEMKEVVEDLKDIEIVRI